MTKEQHKKRHIELHQALDELFADYIQHHPDQINYIEMPLKKLLNWAFWQTKNPDEITKQLWKKKKQN